MVPGHVCELPERLKVVYTDVVATVIIKLI